MRATARDLANWQAGGVIPYGVWKWHGPTRKTRTLYPRLMVRLIVRLRELQNEGIPLRLIKFRLRSLAFHASDPLMGVEDQHDVWASEQCAMILAQIGRPGAVATLDEAIDMALAANYDVHITVTRRA